MDERGAIFIPMRVLISIVVMAAIVGIAFIGLQNAMKVAAEKQVERECNELISMLSTMVKGDARDINNPQDMQGSTRTKEFDLPDKLVYIGFGVDPDPDNDGKLSSKLVGNGSCIFYKVEGMSKKVIWLDNDIKFREGKNESGKWKIKYPEQGFVIKDGGKIKLSFELVKDFSDEYVLILAEDNIEP